MKSDTCWGTWIACIPVECIHVNLGRVVYVFIERVNYRFEGLAESSRVAYVHRVRAP